MANPTFTLTATLEDITGQPAGSTANPAKLLIQLCNHGLYLPAIAGDNNQTEISKEFLSTGGQIAVPLWGNDLINPAGTYYAITVIDGLGRVVQCAAYLITGSGTHDLSTLTPISQLPGPPGPPVIQSELEIVPPSNPTFHASQYLAFKMTLNQSVGSSNISGGVPGNLYTFTILQDGSGGHSFNWPSNTYNMPPISQTPNSLTTAVCLCDENTHFNLAGGATVYDPNA
jgi:hypothetical protein